MKIGEAWLLLESCKSSESAESLIKGIERSSSSQLERCKQLEDITSCSFEILFLPTIYSRLTYLFPDS